MKADSAAGHTGSAQDSNDLIAVLSCERGPANEDTPLIVAAVGKGYAVLPGRRFAYQWFSCVACLGGSPPMAQSRLRDSVLVQWGLPT
jgi:hypothetical protein